MIKVTEMRLDHVDAVAALETVCFSDPWSCSSISSELHNPLSAWFVATEDDTVIGYIGSQTVLDSADMMNIAVAPDYRGQGIGTVLVKHLCDYLKEKSVKSLLLEVRVSNVPAINLYKQLNFTEVGRRRNYYHNPKEDAWIMRKELI